MTNFKRLSVLFVVLCLALCLVFVVSCGDKGDDTNTNTNTNTSTNTDTSTDTNTSTNTDTSTDEATDTYKVRIVNENGNAIAGAMISHCPISGEGSCLTVFTNANGEVDLGADGNTRYVSGAFADGYKSISESHIEFENGQMELVITLEAE